MKILSIGLDNTPYPDRSLEVRVADYMAQQGHQVHLVVERRPKYWGDQPKNLDVTIGPVVQIALNQIQPPPDFVGKLLNMDYDIIFCSSVSGAKLGHLLSQRKGVPWVIQVLDVPAYRFVFEHYRVQWNEWLSLVKEANHVVVNTEVCRQILRRLWDSYSPATASKLPMTTIYYGVDHVTADEAKPLTSDEPFISMVGRLVWDKAFELLFYAMQARSETMPVKIVGSGPEFARLVETAALCKVPVDFRGAHSDLEKFGVIKGSKFGVYTDINTFKSGLFPLECLVTGRPCIAWDTPVNRERYSDYVQYIPYLDIKKLSEEVHLWWGTSQALDSRGERGRKWVMENRTYKQHSEKLIQVFEQTLNR